MLRKMKNRLANKKGFYSIEFTIIALIIVVVIAFMGDMTVIGVQRANMSRMFQQVVDVIERQSGLAREMPRGFHGQETTYYTPSDMMARLEKLKEDNKLSSIKLYINGMELTDNREVLFDHKETFEAKIEYTASWGLLSKVIPGLTRDRTYSHNAVGFTEYKWNYDVWGGE